MAGLMAGLLVQLPGCAESAPEAAEASPAVTDPESEGLVVLDPQNELRPNYHDFGHVAAGDVATHVFRVQNLESVPVTIKDLLPSCSCTTSRIHYIDANGQAVRGNPLATNGVITLPPGAVAELSVRVDSNDIRLKNRGKLTQVRIRSDSPRTPYLTLEMHVIIDLYFAATPWEINLGNVGESVGGQGRTRIVPDPRDSPARIIEISGMSDGLSASLEEEIGPFNTLWNLDVSLGPSEERGAYRGHVDLRTTDPDGAPTERIFRVKVRAHFEADLYTAPRQLLFRDQAATAECVLASHLPGHRFRIHGAEVKGPDAAHFEPQFTPEEPDASGLSDRWRVVLTSDGALEPGRFAGRITLDLGEDQYRSFELSYQGIVR